MIERFIKWVVKLFGLSFEPSFEIIDNLDTFVKEKINAMLEDAETSDIASGYFQISDRKTFAESVEKLLEKGGRVRLFIGDVLKNTF